MNFTHRCHTVPVRDQLEFWNLRSHALCGRRACSEKGNTPVLSKYTQQILTREVEYVVTQTTETLSCVNLQFSSGPSWRRVPAANLLCQTPEQFWIITIGYQFNRDFHLLNTSEAHDGEAIARMLLEKLWKTVWKTVMVITYRRVYSYLSIWTVSGNIWCKREQLCSVLLF